MIALGLATLVSHWRRHPLQLAMLLVGLSLATALWSGVQAINAEARASYDRAAAMLGQDRFDQLVPAAGGTVPQDAYLRLRRAGWNVSPVIEGDWRVGERRIRLVGMDPVTLPRDASAARLTGVADLLRFVTPPGLVYVSPETAAMLADGDTPPLATSDDLLPQTAVADIGIAQALLKLPGAVSRLIVLPDQPAGRPDLAEIAPELVLKPPGPQTDIGALTDSFHLNLTAFGFLAFVVGLFIVYSTIGLAFEQRRATFRTLRSLGMPAGTLMGLAVAELLACAAVAGLAGVALGYLIASVLLPGVAATLRSLYGASIAGALAFRAEWVLGGMAIALGGTLLSAAGSLWRLARMPLLAPAQPRAWARASQRLFLLQAAAGAVLLAGALALVLWGSGLAAGFGALAFLLLGAGLMLPGALVSLLALLARVPAGPVARWFWADTRQQVPGLSLALMALLLAFSANVGVGTMVASFRATFTGWLDQRLAAEAYVTVRSPEEAARIAAWLAPRADAVLPIWNVEGTVAGQPAQVYGVLDHPTYREQWPVIAALPDAWDRVAKGRAAMVSEQLFRRAGLALGGTVALPGGWQAEVAGVYSDYGNPIGQALVGQEAFDRHYPDAPRLRYGVRIAPERVAALRRDLDAAFGLPAGNIIDQASLKQRSLEVFERTFAVTGALNVLTLAVAGVALFSSMTTISAMRLPQLAPVWAMGLTRRRLAFLELCRTVGLVLATLALAIPVGIMLAWLLLAVVNVEAFGWRLPLRLFPSDWPRLAGLALLAAFVSVAVPLRRLSRTPPATLLKVFANER